MHMCFCTKRAFEFTLHTVYLKSHIAKMPTLCLVNSYFFLDVNLVPNETEVKVCFWHYAKISERPDVL